MAPSSLRSHRLGLGIATLAAAAALAAAGAAVAQPVSTASTPAAQSESDQTSRSQGYGYGYAAPGRERPGAAAGGSTARGVQQVNANATDAQISGIVDIVTTVNYDQGQAAGTGIILTADGQVLTNNHVIQGATSIEITVLSTGETYNAEVVGTAPGQDIAVLQLSDATDLTVANLGDSSELRVGDDVVGVGNAANARGTSASPGQVVALDESITATDENGGNAEQLTGLIKTSAAIQAGDSGGPLYDAASEVVGVDTAAASTGRETSGYAIPINTALAIVGQITSGVDNEQITQGTPAFLGVELDPRGSNTIVGVVDGSAAQDAGLGAGDVITSFGQTTIASASTLSEAIASYDAGDRVNMGWTDMTGQSHTATITLGAGPAD